MLHPAYTRHEERLKCSAGLTFSPCCLVLCHSGAKEQLRTFFYCLLERLLSIQEPDRQVLGSVAALQGDKSKTPGSSTFATLGRRRACPNLTGCGHHPNKGCFYQPCQVPDTTTGCSFVRGRESGSEQEHSKCETIGGYYLGLR